MKLLILSLPDLNRINPQRPHHILEYLSKEHEITVLSVNAWWLEDQNENIEMNGLFKDLKYIYLSKNRINSVFQEIFAIFNPEIKKIINSDFDALIDFNSLILGYYVSKVMKKHDKPIMFDICDDLPERIKMSPQIPSFLRSLSKFISNLLMRKIISLSSKVTFVTDSLNQLYNFPKDKSILLPNGVNTSLFYFKDSKKLKTELGLEKKFIIGFSGVLSDWINLEEQFMALKNIIERKNIELKMLVVGGGEKLVYYKNLANKLKIKDYIIFTGHVDYNEVPSYISIMDVCVISLKRTQDAENAHPLKLFEYMACQKPIISTPTNGVLELANDKVLYASNIDEWEEKIIQLFESPELREKLGLEGKKFVNQNYDWEIIGEKFEEILENLRDLRINNWR